MKFVKVAGFENHYEVNENGQIRRIKHFRSTFVGRILKHCKKANGYFTVHLCADGKHHSMTVARVICLGFFGHPPPGKPHAAHIDGNPAHNYLSNVKWKSVKENVTDDRRLHGTMPKGEGHQNSIWTNSQVMEMRRLRSEGMKYKDIGLRFGRDRSSIHQIVKRGWKHLAGIPVSV